MTGEDRRKLILNTLLDAKEPISGSALGKITGVSRQVVVQDIALLRSQGYSIATSHYGYILDKPEQCIRLVKTHHTVDQMEDELTTIVDLGGSILDTVVNHRTYGKVTAPLNVKNRKDIRNFMHDIETGKSSPLSTITSGYHFHHIAADSEETLNEIEAALSQKGYLAEVLPYEVGQIK